jgi:hypothetical protein
MHTISLHYRRHLITSTQLKMPANAILPVTSLATYAITANARAENIVRFAYWEDYDLRDPALFEQINEQITEELRDDIETNGHMFCYKKIKELDMTVDDKLSELSKEHDAELGVYFTLRVPTLLLIHGCKPFLVPILQHSK